MVLMIAMALMTGAAVLAVLWPLSARGTPALADDRADVAFYRQQMAEVDRDLDRGLITAGDAGAAKAEAGRRLLRARPAAERSGPTTGEPALRRRRAAAALAFSGVPLISLAVYGGLGSPDMASRPAGQIAAATVGDVSSALRQIEQHLAANPDDLRGWDVVAPVYLRSGRFADAVSAYSNARRLGGDTPDRLAGLAEALVANAGGVVPDDAVTIMRSALALDPGMARARFYLALAAEQDGRAPEARDAYAAIVADGPPDAPWLPQIRERLAHLERAAPIGGTVPAAVAATPDIEGMVSGLDGRLSASGGSEAEWSRLVRSYVVLGRREDAVVRLGRARAALAGDPPARERLDLLAQDLGLEARQAQR